MEAIVSFVLLSASITVAGPMIVRHGQIVRDQRQMRLALDELSNQLDRLTAIPEELLPQEIASLTPGDLVRNRLPNATLRAEVVPEDGGSRLTLTLNWGAAGPEIQASENQATANNQQDDAESRTAAPAGLRSVSLTGWRFTRTIAAEEETP
jgi:hypothetical protein